MNYELAKQLKDAGFPNAQEIWQEPSNGKLQGWVPTLAELIEACGDDVALIKAENWTAMKYHSIEKEVHSFFIRMVSTPYGASGHTPEDAVAKLWLALRQK